MKTLLVTGGAGFIGGCFVRRAIAAGNVRVINLDALTYAGNLESIPHPGPCHVFIEGSIDNRQLVTQLLDHYRPEAVLNFAAESHVDRSIDGPSAFIRTNIDGTYCLLDAVLEYWRSLPDQSEGTDHRDELPCKQGFRFLQVSTDEVYGSLGSTGYFTETTPYSPNSPYAASKAAADHLVRAWHRTYGLPTLITNCGNNYGPCQFPEKLIPLMTLNAIEGKPLPVYGDGMHVRDWLFVDDHCAALETVLAKGRIGESYNIGGSGERTNLDVVQSICSAVQDFLPNLAHACEDLITFVTDRPGHDRRYAIDATKIRNELGWMPCREFDQGIRETVRWYIDNRNWVERVTSGNYRRERLGIRG